MQQFGSRKGVLLPVFKLRLYDAYYKGGFFNVPVSFERFARPDNGPIDLVIGPLDEPSKEKSIATRIRMERRAFGEGPHRSETSLVTIHLKMLNYKDKSG